jgi:hypothetical protein
MSSRAHCDAVLGQRIPYLIDEQELAITIGKTCFNMIELVVSALT